MRASLIQLFTRNWPIKGAAIFLSLMLYVAVQLQQPVTTDFELGLNVQLPPGRTLQQKLPKIHAQISGKGSQVLRLRTVRGDLTRRMPDTLSSPTWTIRLEPSEVEAQLPKGADVRVVPLITVVPESGQVLHGGVSISPTIARLVGADQNLAGIESVTTIPTEIANVSGAFTRTVPIDTTPLGIVRIAPKQVTVTGEMGALAERSFGGIPVETGAGAVMSFIITPARVSVTVRGPEQRVQALTRDSLRVVAHIAGGGADGAVGRLTVIAPPGITARAIPDSVTLRRRTRRG